MPVAGRGNPRAQPRETPRPVRLGDAGGPLRDPVQKGLTCAKVCRPAASSSRHQAAQTHGSLEIPPGFKLILYWKKLEFDRLQPLPYNASFICEYF